MSNGKITTSDRLMKWRCRDWVFDRKSWMINISIIAKMMEMMFSINELMELMIYLRRCS